MLKKNKLKLKYLITIILIYFLYVLLCKKSKIIEGHNETYHRLLPESDRAPHGIHDDSLEKPEAWPSGWWKTHSDQTRKQIIHNFNKWGSAICRGRSSNGKIASLNCLQILQSTEYNLESSDRSEDRSSVANVCNNACLTDEQIQAFQTIADTVLHYGGNWHSAVLALRSGARMARRPTNPPTPQAVIDLLENENIAKAWTQYVYLFDENFDMARLRRWYIEPAHWELGGEWVPKTEVDYSQRAAVVAGRRARAR